MMSVSLATKGTAFKREVSWLRGTPDAGCSVQGSQKVLHKVVGILDAHRALSPVAAGDQPGPPPKGRRGADAKAPVSQLINPFIMCDRT